MWKMSSTQGSFGIQHVVLHVYFYAKLTFYIVLKKKKKSVQHHVCCAVCNVSERKQPTDAFTNGSLPAAHKLLKTSFMYNAGNT